MAYAVLHKYGFGPAVDRVKLCPTEKEAKAWLDARREEHLKLVREYASPLAMRHAKTYFRRSYSIVKWDGAKV